MTPLLDIFGRPHKTCPSCGYFLPFEKFYNNHTQNDGLSGYCKKCDRKRINESRANKRLTLARMQGRFEEMVG